MNNFALDRFSNYINKEFCIALPGGFVKNHYWASMMRK